MRKIIFNNNEEYFKFYNRYKEKLEVYYLNFTKTMKIRLFYDIM